jgi:hypothetical protein
MNRDPTTARALIRDVALLQLKLLLDALRDLALSPLALAAAGVDLALIKRQPPRYFRAVLRFGGQTDHWIDVWSGGRDETAPGHENVDSLMARVEDIIRDPQTGARQARILKRWATRQATRAHRQAVARLTAGSGTAPPPPPPSGQSPAG